MSELPHKKYIEYLFSLGFNKPTVEKCLSDNDLVLPTEKQLSEIQSYSYREPAVNQYLKDDEPPKPKKLNKNAYAALELLSHPDREILDALCVLYAGNYSKISKELLDYDIELTKGVVEEYSNYFWNKDAVLSRANWRRFLKLVDDGDKEYKNILKLAKLGDQELLFWKLGRPKKFNLTKTEIENAMQLAYMKAMETKYMPGDAEKVARVGAAWLSQFVALASKYQDVVEQSQFPEFMKMLEEGVEVDTAPMEHPSLEDVSPQPKKLPEKKVADIIPIKKKNA